MWRLSCLESQPSAGHRPSACGFSTSRCPVRTDLLRACWWDGWMAPSAGCRSQCRKSICMLRAPNSPTAKGARVRSLNISHETYQQKFSLATHVYYRLLVWMCRIICVIIFNVASILFEPIGAAVASYFLAFRCESRIDLFICFLSESHMRCVFQNIEPSVYETVLLWSVLAPQCVAWHTEDKPFAAGYPDGKILLASTETYENEQPVVLCVFQVCFQNALILIAVCWRTWGKKTQSYALHTLVSPHMGLFLSTTPLLLPSLYRTLWAL